MDSEELQIALDQLDPEHQEPPTIEKLTSVNRTLARRVVALTASLKQANESIKALIDALATKRGIDRLNLIEELEDFLHDLKRDAAVQ